MVSAHRELYANISSMDSNDNDERDARPRAPLPAGAVNNRTRVAVGISGQLRSFGRTWRSLLKTVIEPTLAEGYELAIFAAVATTGESSARLADDHAALGAFHVALARSACRSNCASSRRTQRQRAPVARAAFLRANPLFCLASRSADA